MRSKLSLKEHLPSSKPFHSSASFTPAAQEVREGGLWSLDHTLFLLPLREKSPSPTPCGVSTTGDSLS